MAIGHEQQRMALRDFSKRKCIERLLDSQEELDLSILAGRELE